MRTTAMICLLVLVMCLFAPVAPAKKKAPKRHVTKACGVYFIYRC